MHQMFRQLPADGSALLDGRTAPVHFQLIRPARGEVRSVRVPGCELAAVVLGGSFDLRVDNQDFPAVGRRPDVWSGRADTVYVPAGAELSLMALTDAAELAVVGGPTAARTTPFRVTPEEVELVEVGSAATHSRRRIFHLLGQNGHGRVGNLLVSELHADGGCWSGYPPHKHDREQPPEETEFAELYHYRFNPAHGFGAQLVYDRGGESQAYVTHTGDTFLFTSGYHPTVTSPGHDEYLLTVLVGRHGRSLIQNFQEEYRDLMATIPGIAAMRAKFK